MARWWKTIKHNPSAVLLAVQLLGIVLYPFFEGGPDDAFGRSVISLFGLVVLVLAVLAVQRTPLITWVSWLIGLPVLVLTVVDAFTGWVQP